MAYGTLNERQVEALKPFLQVTPIHDLGAGDMELAQQLIQLGARRVVAIDKELPRKVPPEGVVPVGILFEHYRGPVDTAFVSWPINHYDVGLLSLIAGARTVIYLGTNTGGSACGFAQMWHLLALREVLVHEPDQASTLIIYGRKPKTRQYLPEEYTGLFQERMWSYEDIHAIASTLPTVGMADVPR